MGRGRKIEFTAALEDSCAEVESVTEAPWIGLWGLNYGVGSPLLTQATLTTLAITTRPRIRHSDCEEPN